MNKGTVKEYDRLKGFGFITGQKVSFDIMFDMKGDKAINVRTD